MCRFITSRCDYINLLNKMGRMYIWMNGLSTITPEICEFYQYSGLDFEQTNLWVVRFLRPIVESFVCRETKTETTDISRILDTISQMNTKIERIETGMCKYSADLSTQVGSKIGKFKKECMDELKTAMHTATTDQSKEILACIRETNMRGSADIDKKVLEEFAKTVQQSLAQTQATLMSLIGVSESRLDARIQTGEHGIQDLKSVLLQHQAAQQTLQTSMTDILKKFDNSSCKGNLSENLTYSMLVSMFPHAQIDSVGDQKETGDIILVRQNRPRILIENKDHETRNVPKTDVAKFIRDCEIQNCCGIMLAQHRGITNKQNFELQIHQRNVLLYVHEVRFDANKIKTAIEIVEHFKLKLDEMVCKDDDVSIDQATLDEINKECAAYAAHKQLLMKLMKDHTEKMTAAIHELKLPHLEKYLSSRFASTATQQDTVCKFCEKTVPKSMTQHYRYCSAKHECKVQPELGDVIDYDSSGNTRRRSASKSRGDI